MAKKMKVGDKRPVRPIGDGFVYTNTRFDTPDDFKKRMTDRAIVAVWDEAHRANEVSERPRPNVEQLKRKRA